MCFEAELQEPVTFIITTILVRLQSLRDLMSYARIPPAVNQVEAHPLNTQVKHVAMHAIVHCLSVDASFLLVERVDVSFLLVENLDHICTPPRPQSLLHRFCTQLGIAMTAFSPLASRCVTS